MSRFVILVFGFLALVFYEVSGGAAFSPSATRLAALEARQDGSVVSSTKGSAAIPPAPRDQMARADLRLVSFEEAMAQTGSAPAKSTAAAILAKPDPGYRARPVTPAPAVSIVSAVPKRVGSDPVSLEEATMLVAATATQKDLSPAKPQAPATTGVLPKATGPARPQTTASDSIRFEGSTTRASSHRVLPDSDRRVVNAELANLRGGPGIGYGVVGQLPLGVQVEVLGDNGSGWVRLRPVGGGPVGWVADFLLIRP